MVVMVSVVLGKFSRRRPLRYLKESKGMPPKEIVVHWSVGGVGEKDSRGRLSDSVANHIVRQWFAVCYVAICHLPKD